MGTREDLLAGAKQCLAERGLARTTVRDIVAASGTNLAAINYHFGTRDKLLNQAMLESTAEAVSHLLDTLPADTELDSAGRLHSFWTKLLASFGSDRTIWSANVEALAHSLHSPEIRAEIGVAQQLARDGLSRDLGNDNPDVGMLLQSLIVGLLVQALVNPDHAPTAESIASGIRALADLSTPAPH
ncbi:TetR/AcrR family transcriptional regulator [Nocardia sp. NPDC020380]|uniref:TetR/AcrR family transcriptional regulator n=1 Tax=Nocardia sp. NPDC020380 TaxID=3364309 RepID=UPI0037B1375A